jgi:hypothetical protein
MSVSDFHRSRRMFCINDGEVLVGPQNSPLSHKEWLTTLGYDSEKLIEESVRGFADDRGLFFYKGTDFKVDRDTEETLLNHLNELRDILQLQGDTRVYGGVIPTDDVKYPPEREYGTIEELTTK